LTLQVEWQEGHPAHKNPVVIPVSLCFVRALVCPGYPAVKRLFVYFVFSLKTNDVLKLTVITLSDAH